MNTNIMVKNFNLFDGARNHIETGLEELNKLLEVDANYRVHIKKREYGEYECMISTTIDSKHFNIKATRDSVKFCIEAAIKAMKDTVLEYRSKVVTKRINAAYAVDKHEEAAVEKGDKITKVKNVHLTPVSDAEAIEALNESDKDMYMYLDEETLEVKGVYYRADGYGVINFKTV